MVHLSLSSENCFSPIFFSVIITLYQISLLSFSFSFIMKLVSLSEAQRFFFSFCVMVENVALLCKSSFFLSPSPLYLEFLFSFLCYHCPLQFVSCSHSFSSVWFCSEREPGPINFESSGTGGFYALRVYYGPFHCAAVVSNPFPCRTLSSVLPAVVESPCR